MEGSCPHFGDILFGSKGQTPPGVVQASHRFVILITSPQLYEMVPKSNEVITPAATGPPQPVLVVDDINAPVVPLYISKVPQKAKAPLVDPVVLLMDKVNVLVSNVAEAHELHKSPPVNLAATTSKSFEVHEVFAGGTDCANVIEILSMLNTKNAKSFFEIVIFDFIQLNLVE